jgi:hypothetical protein
MPPRDFAPAPLDDAEDANINPPIASKTEITKNLESVAVATARLKN